MNNFSPNFQTSPRMTPSSSTEKLKTVGGTAKKLSKEDAKGSAGRLGSQSPLQAAVEVSSKVISE